MMGPQRTDPHIQKTLTSRGFDLIAEISILGRAEVELVEVGAPEKSADINSSTDGRD
jgi:hypothetical protein